MNSYIKLISAILILIFSISFYSCSSSIKNERKAAPKFDNTEQGNLRKILYYSSLAGSAHNTQPWKVIAYNNDSIQIFLNEKNLTNNSINSHRYSFISLGAFVENFEVAASNLGYEAKITIQPNSNGISTPAVIIKLSPNKDLSKTLTLADIAQRRTLRTQFKTDEIEYDHVQELVGIDRGHIHYFDRLTRSWQYISERTQIVANNANKGKIDNKVYNLIENSRGWISIMFPEDNVMNWINTGRLYERMNLKAKKLNIGFHPMNILLSDEDSANNLKTYLKRNEYTFLLIRVGYVDHTPPPVTSRNNIDDFTTFK